MEEASRCQRAGPAKKPPIVVSVRSEPHRPSTPEIARGGDQRFCPRAVRNSLQVVSMFLMSFRKPVITTKVLMPGNL